MSMTIVRIQKRKFSVIEMADLQYDKTGSGGAIMPAFKGKGHGVGLKPNGAVDSIPNN